MKISLTNGWCAILVGGLASEPRMPTKCCLDSWIYGSTMDDMVTITSRLLVHPNEFTALSTCYRLPTRLASNPLVLYRHTTTAATQASSSRDIHLAVGSSIFMIDEEAGLLVDSALGAPSPFSHIDVGRLIWKQHANAKFMTH